MVPKYLIAGLPRNPRNKGIGRGGKRRGHSGFGPSTFVGVPVVWTPWGARAGARAGRGEAGRSGAEQGAGPGRPSPRPVGRRRGARAAGGGARSPRAARPRRKVFPDGVLAVAAGAAMDALKSAGRALIRSPSLAKQSWGGGGRHRSECVRVRRAGAVRGSRPKGPASRGRRGQRRGLPGALRPCRVLRGFGGRRGSSRAPTPVPALCGWVGGAEAGGECGARGPQVQAAVGGATGEGKRRARSPAPGHFAALGG